MVRWRVCGDVGSVTAHLANMFPSSLAQRSRPRGAVAARAAAPLSRAANIAASGGAAVAVALPALADAGGAPDVMLAGGAIVGVAGLGGVLLATDPQKRRDSMKDGAGGDEMKSVKDYFESAGAMLPAPTQLTRRSSLLQRLVASTLVRNCADYSPDCSKSRTSRPNLGNGAPRSWGTSYPRSSKLAFAQACRRPRAAGSDQNTRNLATALSQRFHALLTCQAAQSRSNSETRRPNHSAAATETQCVQAKSQRRRHRGAVRSGYVTAPPPQRRSACFLQRRDMITKHQFARLSTEAQRVQASSAGTKSTARRTT